MTIRQFEAACRYANAREKRRVPQKVLVVGQEGMVALVMKIKAYSSGIGH